MDEQVQVAFYVLLTTHVDLEFSAGTVAFLEDVASPCLLQVVAHGRGAGRAALVAENHFWSWEWQWLKVVCFKGVAELRLDRQVFRAGILDTVENK